METLLAHWGYLAVAVGAFLEGETVLMAATALAHQGLLSLPAVLLVSLSGALLRDQFWFQIGRRFGRALLTRHPVWRAKAAAVQQRIDRHDRGVVLGFRFVYGLRTFTPVVLGASSYSAVRFAGLNVVGASVWVAVVASLGWSLGGLVARATTSLEHIGFVVGAVLVGAIALRLLWRHLQQPTRRAGTVEAKMSA